jgi:hypothetical protein
MRAEAMPPGRPTSSAESTPRADLAGFAGHVFDISRDQLSKGGTPIRLTPKARTLLHYLLQIPSGFSGRKN